MQAAPFGAPYPSGDVTGANAGANAGLVGTVEYRELGVTLRHSSWKGIRADMDSALVTPP